MEEQADNPDNPPFREDNLGFAFLHLKIATDALVAATNPPEPDA